MSLNIKNFEIPIFITPATAHDIPTIITLAQRIWPVAYAEILTPQQIGNMLEKIYSAENLQAEMANGHRFWMAHHDSTPIAYASAYRENADIIWLKKIYVDSTMQGKGAGRQLIDIVIAAFTPAQELRLLTNPHNTPAQRYYSHHGFRKIGEVPVRMGDWHFDDHIYSKTITED